MRQEGAGQQEQRCREREPPCDQQAPAARTGERGCILSPQLKALLATASLCLKSHQLVIVPGVTLEMSMASWQGLKQSSACLWCHPTSCYLLDLKINSVFSEQRIQLAGKGRYFRIAFHVVGTSCSSNNPCYSSNPSQNLAYLPWLRTGGFPCNFLFNKEKKLVLICTVISEGETDATDCVIIFWVYGNTYPLGRKGMV